MPNPPLDIEAMMLGKLRNYAARKPQFKFLLSDLKDIAALCHSVVPVPRPPDVEQRGPRTIRERALAVAALEAATAGPGAPRAASEAPLGQSDALPPMTAREKALQRLRADPLCCAVLALVVQGLDNRAITQQLGVEMHQVKARLRRWFAATETNCRQDLAAWAKRHGLNGPGAGR